MNGFTNLLANRCWRTQGLLKLNSTSKDDEAQFLTSSRIGNDFVKNRECYEIEIYMDDSGHAY